MTAAIAALPFRFFDLRVKRTARLGPSFVRVTFDGAELADVACGGRDQRVKLFFPHPDQEVPVMPADCDEDWFGRWRAMDPQVRAVMRSYTIREHRRDAGELDIDFAVHGAGGGPASQWASRAGVGSRVVFLGPVVEDNGGVDFRPPADTDWVLLTGDETALPAVEAILSWLPARTEVRVWIEVASPDDIRGLPTRARAEITWLVREPAHEPIGGSAGQSGKAGHDGEPGQGGQAGQSSETGLGGEGRYSGHADQNGETGQSGEIGRSGQAGRGDEGRRGSAAGQDGRGSEAGRDSRDGAMLAAVRRAQLPSGTPYAWIAGESGDVRALRRHLVNERGFARDSVVFTGYWRRGAGEDDLLAEHFSNSLDQG